MTTTSSRISPLVRPLATGFIAASTAASASAAFIYNDTPIIFAGDADTEFNDQLNLDGGSPDFSTYVYTGKNFIDALPSQFSITPINGNTITGELSFGDPINATSGFSTNKVQVIGDASDHYYGFQLNGGGTPSYGWLSVTHFPGTGNGSGRINAWGYDDTGADVTVGQTTAAVPEPASAAAVAALLAGSAAVWKRRRRKFEAAAIAA